MMIDCVAYHKAALRRAKIFKDAKAPQLEDLANARVTVFRPLKTQDYGLVYHNDQLYVGRGTLQISLMLYCN